MAGLGLAATRDFVSFLRHATAADGQSARRRRAAHLQLFHLAALTHLERLPDAGLQRGRRRPARHRRHAQPDRRRQRRSNQLSVRADRKNRAQPPEPPVPGRRVPVRPSGVDRSPQRQDRRARAQRCTASNTCPKRFEVNSSNEYWVKAGSLLHTDTQGQRPEGSGERALLPDVRPVARRRGHTPTGHVPAVHQRGQPLSRASCAPGRARRVGEQRDRAAEERGAAALRRDGGVAVPRPGSQTGVVPQDGIGLADDSRRDLHRADHDSILARLRAGCSTTASCRTTRPRSPDVPPIRSSCRRWIRDGNEIAGVRLPPVAAPIATTTGWALAPRRVRRERRM